MINHHCDGGFYEYTLATLRVHAKKCERATAKIGAVEDRARVERFKHATWIKAKSREDQL